MELLCVYDHCFSLVQQTSRVFLLPRSFKAVFWCSFVSMHVWFSRVVLETLPGWGLMKSYLRCLCWLLFHLVTLNGSLCCRANLIWTRSSSIKATIQSSLQVSFTSYLLQARLVCAAFRRQLFLWGFQLRWWVMAGDWYRSVTFNDLWLMLAERRRCMLAPFNSAALPPEYKTGMTSILLRCRRKKEKQVQTGCTVG